MHIGNRSAASQSRNAALGGVMGSLGLLCLCGAVYMPTGRISLYALCSVFCGIVAVESGVGSGWVCFAATSVLSLILIPDRAGVIPYLFFFGPYGLVKYHIESLRSRPLHIILKTAFFLISMTAIVCIVKGLLVGNVSSKLPPAVIVPAGLVIFYIYDYVYSMMIYFYIRRIRIHLRH